MSQTPTAHIEHTGTFQDLEPTTVQLQKARSRLDSLRRTLQQPPFTIQRTPTYCSSRQLTFKRTATSWTRPGYEWTGTDRRHRGREKTTTATIRPTHSFPEPAGPPTLEDRLNHAQPTTRALTDSHAANQ